MCTEKQLLVLNVIRNYIEENKMSPTVREICSLAGIKSTSTVYGYLERLERQGCIMRKDNIARSIVLCEQKL